MTGRPESPGKGPFQIFSKVTINEVKDAPKDRGKYGNIYRGKIKQQEHAMTATPSSGRFRNREKDNRWARA